MPHIKCTPCRVRYGDHLYRIKSDGAVFRLHFVQCQMLDNSLYCTCIESARKDPLLTAKDLVEERMPLPEEFAKPVRKDAQRQRRNRNARERHAAMRDLGMKRTSYGYE